VLDQSGKVYFFLLNYSENLQNFEAIGFIQINGTKDEFDTLDVPSNFYYT
jgi:hypothetical protein